MYERKDGIVIFTLILEKKVINAKHFCVIKELKLKVQDEILRSCFFRKQRIPYNEPILRDTSVIIKSKLMTIVISNMYVKSVVKNSNILTI